MALFKFDREFWHWGRNPRCVLCKALALFVFKPSAEPIEIDEAAARDAEAAGAGKRVNYEAMQQ